MKHMKNIPDYPDSPIIKMSDGFKANAAFFKLGFLDKTQVSLGRQFKEMLPTLWMKAGAHGPCPTIDEGVPDILILPDNRLAILNEENLFANFAEILENHPEIEMSFAVRNDPTYIAQLLGRMVRTPLQMRVTRDEFLNDVKLYLPHFDRETVKKVVEELQSNEGGEIPTEINGESLEEPTHVIWTVNIPRRPQVIVRDPNQPNFLDPGYGTDTAANTDPAQVSEGVTNSPIVQETPANYVPSAPEIHIPEGNTVVIPISEAHQQAATQPETEILHGEQLTLTPELDRVAIIDFINGRGFLTYFVRYDRQRSYGFGVKYAENAHIFLYRYEKFLCFGRVR